MDIIKAVWETEQEILDVVHKVCKENNLRYSLACGTLLGAVRHKGFIPWDDDIDIYMPYEDYRRLLEIWNDVAPRNYILQNNHTDSDFTQTFTKIRKDHTTFLQADWEKQKKYHKGIFVDIFPLYRVAPRKIGRMFQYMACAINLLYSRGHTSNVGGLIGVGERILLVVPRNIRIRVRETMECLISRWEQCTSSYYISPATINAAKRYYASDIFDDIVTIEFQKKVYHCSSNYVNMLEKDFGNYMQLPPEKERVWKHNPILIDFNYNYEELVEIYEQ